MNISPFLIYLWQQVDSFRFLVGSTLILSTVAVIVSLINMDDCKNNDSSNLSFHTRIFRTTLISALISLMFVVFIPNSKTIAMMVIIPEIANSKVIQEDLPEVFKAGKDALIEQLTSANKKQK